MNSDRQIHFKLNGRPVKATVSTQENLVELLRRLDLFGARESCGQGLCGCCSVIVDNVAVSGCLTLAILVDGTSVATFDNSQATLTLLDEDYVLIAGADTAVIGGNTYDVRLKAPPIGLFEVTVYTLELQARDES